MWAPHRQLGFVSIYIYIYIYVAIVRSRSGMQLPFNVSARAHVEPRSRSSEPSLDRSTKRVMDDTDGDDEERPAQRVVIHRRRSYTFVSSS